VGRERFGMQRTFLLEEAHEGAARTDSMNRFLACFRRHVNKLKKSLYNVNHTRYFPF
jgi:hypothetical protein